MVKNLTVDDIGDLVGGTVSGDGGVVITGCASITDASGGEITFVRDRKHLKDLEGTRASAVIVYEEAEVALEVPVIRATDPYIAFIKVLNALYSSDGDSCGISEEAYVSDEARIDEGVTVHRGAHIEEGVKIGSGSVIHPQVYIGKGVVIGSSTVLHPGVKVYKGSIIGSGVTVHANTVIGSDGFGYHWDGGRHLKVPQVGIVRIEDNVEIGACTCIDRATTGETVIGEGTKVDNLVQIAHNVKIGKFAVVAGQSGMGGSTVIGTGVVLAAQSGVADHLTIGDGAVVGGKAGVASDIEGGATVSGAPAIPHKEWLRGQLSIAKLPDLKRRLKALEKKVAEKIIKD